MKLKVKGMLVAAAVLSGIALTGCASPFPVGIVYTQATLPVTVGNGDMKFSKKGESKAISLFGLFASGDASINHACKDAGITKVGWVNQEVRNILGIYGEYKTVVYGTAE